MPKNIVFLYSKNNIGDTQTSKAIFEKLSQSTEIGHIYYIDANMYFTDLQANYLNISQKDIVFAIGEKGLDALLELDRNKLIDKNESFIALSIHQYNDNIKNLPLDYIALPEIVVNSEDRKEIISRIPSSTLTFAVATQNPTKEELKQKFDDWNIENKPSLEDDYIIVMLPGDAPDSTGKMRYFSKDSASLLAKDMVALWNNYGNKHKIIVHNGPRTGKYDEKSGNLICNHFLDEQIDEVSKYFLELLAKEKVDFRFFNFSFDIDKNPISVYYQLLYIAQLPNKQNYFIVPGESVSMLGQIPLYVQSNKIIVFKPSSMNEDHRAIFNLAFEHSYLSYFEDNGNIIEPLYVTHREHTDEENIVLDLLSGKCIDVH